MKSNHKGAVAELEIAAAAVKLGIPVFRPLSEHSRTHLVLEIEGALMRVQCKWGRLSESGDVVIVDIGGTRLSNHATSGALTPRKRSSYSVCTAEHSIAASSFPSLSPAASA